MFTATENGHGRIGLDALVERIGDPGFTVRFRRVPEMRERTGHVSPSMLAMQQRRSRYVRTWARHARRCHECAAIFTYLGFPVR
jgi:hypothetical protein